MKNENKSSNVFSKFSNISSII